MSYFKLGKTHNKGRPENKSKISLQLMNKFAYLGKIWTGWHGLNLERKG